jgi:sulfatase maturation enzyme AslB (radical SAM superfamily)
MIPAESRRVNEIIDKYLETAKKINFVGGEPTIIKEYWDILDRLIENKMFDIPLKFTTNASTLTFGNKNILDYWKHFKKVKVDCSIDDFGQRAEYLRCGTQWNDVFNNLKTINNFFGELCISLTFSSLNAIYIKEIIDFLNSNFTNIHIAVNFAYGPRRS